MLSMTLTMPHDMISVTACFLVCLPYQLVGFKTAGMAGAFFSSSRLPKTLA
jgi:hypothetical protein